jgi:hypothetical protein
VPADGLRRACAATAALLVTLACCLAVAALLLGAVAWGLGRAGARLVANSDRLQLLYERFAGRAEAQGL